MLVLGGYASVADNPHGALDLSGCLVGIWSLRSRCARSRESDPNETLRRPARCVALGCTPAGQRVPSILQPEKDGWAGLGQVKAPAHLKSLSTAGDDHNYDSHLGRL